MTETTMTETTSPAPVQGTKPRTRRWLLEVGVVGVAYAGITSWQTSGLLESGTSAPTFTTTDLLGNRFTLEQFADRRLVLHFWASWCGVCRQEFGMLNEFHAREGCLLGLVAEDPSEGVVDFVRKHDLRYPVVYAPAELVRAYRISAFPTSYYLSKEHLVSSATVGMSTGLAMRARMMLAG
jgi:thiol-disulfide isomerase/thioredoxin